MSDVAVTLPKKEYDELVEFKKDIMANNISVVHSESGSGGFYTSRHAYEYSALPEIIEKINNREKHSNKEEINSYLLKDIERTRLMDDLVEKLDIAIKALSDEIKNSWWRFWK